MIKGIYTSLIEPTDFYREESFEFRTLESLEHFSKHNYINFSLLTSCNQLFTIVDPSYHFRIAGLINIFNII